MAIWPILTEPDVKLRQRSMEVKSVTKEVLNILDDMLDTMYHMRGIGLAAPQINVLQRLIVIDVPSDSLNAQLKMINPQIVWKSEIRDSLEEGCLSIPGYREVVYRPKEVKVRFLDTFAIMQEQLFTGLEAVCVQHEIDHLDGILFIDHLSYLKKAILKKKKLVQS